ncbi:MAG TPA: hypothetical protein VGA88_02715 [Burkholderiales bacterium]
MSASDLLWIFFIIIMLQPLLRQRMLEWARARQLRRLELKRGTRAITLIHRQVSMAFLGIPVMRFIDVNDSEEIIRAIRLTDDRTPTDLIVHAPAVKMLGLPVSQELDPVIYELMRLYPQPVRQSAAVKYIRHGAKPKVRRPFARKGERLVPPVGRAARFVGASLSWPRRVVPQ